MPHATVAHSMLRALLDYLGAQGLDRSRLAHDAGVAMAALAYPERRADASRYIALLRAGIEASQNPLLGLEFGMAARPQRWGTLGLLLGHGANLGEALAVQARFAHLVNSVGHGELVQRPKHVELIWRSDVAMPALVEEAFAAWVCFARWASGQAHAPLRVTFAHRAQGDPAIYGALFKCPVDFSRATSTLQFDADLLDQPLRAPDAELAATLEARVARHEQSEAAQDVVHALERWLAGRLAHGSADLARAAAALDLSERTLQHRLQAGGTNFRQCLDRVRRALATRYLADPALSIGAVSIRLGFSEQSAFQRAFRRWHGCTPMAWRHRLGRPDGCG
ncbi:AraC family transcriptional regulator [Salinisphaera aquimarina]|uniref:AraC family transcriptional regulator ligand-binding domain-containing protein n=1 Tax=Salinisphaera aquimarina TaxID=2094031 RepID=A0ABV7EU55_9GAMM